VGACGDCVRGQLVSAHPTRSAARPDGARAAEADLDALPDLHNIPLYRDPAVMLIDQLKEISIAGELDIVETANWNPKVTRRDYMVGLENTGSAVVDDPDQQLYESYACESDRNFTGYCNRRLEDLFHQQSRETDLQRRRELVWDIDRTLQEEGARPVIFHTRGATCWHPQVKGLTTMVNSIYNGWRMEDIWLDK
jgi:peptide/nickel transport system substrate-binding protein